MARTAFEGEIREIVEAVNKMKVTQLKEALKRYVLLMDGLKADLRPPSPLTCTAA